MWFEMSAVRYMLDCEHPQLDTVGEDERRYILGELSGHNVAIAWLSGAQGASSAAAVATNMGRTFPCIKWRFLVGTAGGVPSETHDIRLGDVVISMPEGQFGGVVQFDLGRDTEDGCFRKGFLSPPPLALRLAAGVMRSDHLIKDNQVDSFVRPNPTCSNCDKQRTVARLPRGSDGSKIHYGLVASGGKVMKSATKRIRATEELGDILCFDMEAASIATEFSCMVIRGISNYADSHKHNTWKGYAAAAAAATVRELLSYVQPAEPFADRIRRDSTGWTINS
ncbi:superkiller [Madurella fahalii]|uniref:Superkiller n=1 Tax=Madurella fahalii TaxID=1157608 RepID=A0ABQ0GF37_9PEZI